MGTRECRPFAATSNTRARAYLCGRDARMWMHVEHNACCSIGLASSGPVLRGSRVLRPVGPGLQRSAGSLATCQPQLDHELRHSTPGGGMAGSGDYPPDAECWQHAHEAVSSRCSGVVSPRSPDPEACSATEHCDHLTSELGRPQGDHTTVTSCRKSVQGAAVKGATMSAADRVIWTPEFAIYCVLIAAERARTLVAA